MWLLLEEASFSQARLVQLTQQMSKMGGAAPPLLPPP
jgi:hypothetical protein